MENKIYRVNELTSEQLSKLWSLKDNTVVGKLIKRSNDSFPGNSGSPLKSSIYLMWSHIRAEAERNGFVIEDLDDVQDIRQAFLTMSALV